MQERDHWALGTWAGLRPSWAFWVLGLAGRLHSAGDIVPRLGEAACGSLSGWGASSARGQQDVLSPLTGDRQSRLAEHNATVTGPYWGQCDHQVRHVFESGLENRGSHRKGNRKQGDGQTLASGFSGPQPGGLGTGAASGGGSALGRVAMVTLCPFLPLGGEVCWEGL